MNSINASEMLFHHQDKIASGLIVTKLPEPGLWIHLFNKLEDLRGGQHPVITSIVTQ